MALTLIQSHAASTAHTKCNANTDAHAHRYDAILALLSQNEGAMVKELAREIHRSLGRIDERR